MLKWEEIVQNYIIKYSNQIQKTTKPLRDHFGISYFTYHRIDNDGKYTVLVDRPDWAEYFVSEQIYQNDPYLRHPSVYQSGISIIENQGSPEYQEMIVKGGKQVLDMDTGAMLVQKGQDHVEFFGFAGKKRPIENLYLNRPQILSSFAAHFKNNLGRILRQMEGEAGSLIDLKGEDYACLQPIAPDFTPESLCAFYRDLGMEADVEKAARLSARERQCLKLLIQDMSAKETGATLRLSKRTVEYYFENIKDKLECWNKQEVLRAAKNLDEMGLI